MKQSKLITKYIVALEPLTFDAPQKDIINRAIQCDSFVVKNEDNYFAVDSLELVRKIASSQVIDLSALSKKILSIDIDKEFELDFEKIKFGFVVVDKNGYRGFVPKDNVLLVGQELLAWKLEESERTLKKSIKKLVDKEKQSSLTVLVAGVAHEINTPLGICVTAASTLADKNSEFYRNYKSGMAKKSDFENFINTVQDCSSILLSNSHRAFELVKSFKMISVDQSTDERREFDIVNYTKEVLASLKMELKKKNIQVKVIGESQLLVDNTPGAWAQMVTNLVMNSLLHGFESATCGEIEISIDRNEDDFCVMYKDDGKGISKSISQKIFEPFFTTKRGVGGTGLGLSIVNNIVSSVLKGSIQHFCPLNGGAGFIIRAPIGNFATKGTQNESI
jgi:signal transduction histidine kinase